MQYCGNYNEHDGYDDGGGDDSRKFAEPVSSYS